MVFIYSNALQHIKTRIELIQAPLFLDFDSPNSNPISQSIRNKHKTLNLQKAAEEEKGKRNKKSLPRTACDE